MLSFKKYLNSIKPTTRGSIAMLTMLLILPILVDLLILVVLKKNEYSMLAFVFGNYIPMIPFLFIYLTVFYLIWAGWISIKNHKIGPPEAKQFEFEKKDDAIS